MANRLVSLLLGLLLGGVGGPLAGQRMEPDAPVKNFTLPFFGEDGYRTWDLQGSEGRYLSPRELEVDQMILRIFAEGEPVEPQTVIQSPAATIYPAEKLAAGRGVIFISERGGAFSIFGTDWRWDGNADRITIVQGARVTFRESIGSIIQ